MATTGSKNTNSYTTSSGATRYYTFTWTETAVSGNISTISWTLKSAGTYTSWINERTVSVSITAKNGTLSGTTSYSKTDVVQRKSGETVASGTFKVTRDSSGKGIFNYSIQVACYTSAVNLTASSSGTLSEIRKATLYYYANGGTIAGDSGTPGVHKYTNSSGTTTMWFKLNSSVIQQSTTSASSGFTNFAATVYTTTSTIDLTNVGTFGLARAGYHIPDNATAYIVNSTTPTSSNTVSQVSTSSFAPIKNAISSANATVKLYPNWTNNTYKLKYDGNGGTLTEDYCLPNGTVAQTAGSTYIYHEDNTSYSANTYPGYCTYDKNNGLFTGSRFTRPGYVFKEWNTKADGTGTSYQQSTTYKLNLTTTNNATVTLYAIWEEVVVSTTAYVKVNGDYVQATPYIKVDGDWVEPQSVYVKHEGSWIQV